MPCAASLTTVLSCVTIGCASSAFVVKKLTGGRFQLSRYGNAAQCPAAADAGETVGVAHASVLVTVVRTSVPAG